MVVERIRIESEQQWRELPQRRQDLTASVVAAPLGLHTWVTPAEIYAEKTGRGVPGKKVSSVLRRGKQLEPLFLPLLRQQFPDCRIEPADEYLREPENRLGATPDVYMHRPDGALVNVQLKTTGRTSFGKHWVDGPPLWVTLQALCEASLADAVESIVAVMVIDEWSALDTLELFTVPRHATSEARLRTTSVEFWKAIAENRMPAFDYLRDAKLIAALWPKTVAGKTIDLGADNLLPVLLEEHEKIVGEIKSREERKDAIAAEVRAKMEDAEVGIIGGWLITLREVIRKAHAVKESKTRQLRIKRVE
jgi:predicted phage-related endonuclease